MLRLRSVSLRGPQLRVSEIKHAVAAGTVTFAQQTSDHSAGEREFKCHKMILCRNSEYFKAMFGRSGFKESEQPIVELHDDDPLAVEVVLRYLYGFEYHHIELHFDFSLKLSLETVSIHMSNFIAVQRYLLPLLESAILTRLEEYISLLHRTSLPMTEAEPTLNIIKLLLAKSNHHESFLPTANSLISKRLPDLYELPEFRRLLETDQWKDTMTMCMKAVR